MNSYQDQASVGVSKICSAVINLPLMQKTPVRKCDLIAQTVYKNTGFYSLYTFGAVCQSDIKPFTTMLLKM